MSESKVRVGGSGWTRFEWRGATILWAKTISDRAPQAVAGPSVIQGIAHEVPVEIATPRAVGHGELVLQLWDLWERSAWKELSGLEGANSILDVLKQQVALGNVTCRKIIDGPNGQKTTVEYYGCTVTDIDESENISLGQMDITRTIKVLYTHKKTL